jgi:glucuronosyltransferase
LSSQEALYHEVPIIGVPVTHEQYQNVMIANDAGYGIYLDAANITKSSLIWALNTALYSKKYDCESICKRIKISFIFSQYFAD